MDLYPIALALFGTLAIAALASLKSTMSEITHQERVQENLNNKKNPESVQEDEQNKKKNTSSCKIFKYFLVSYTVLLVFSKRTGIQLLSFLLAYSLVGIYLYFTTFWYPAVGFALIISVTSIILQLIQEKSIKSPNSESQNKSVDTIKIKKVLFISIALITIGFYLSLFGLCFKNYFNSQLLPMLINFGFIFAIDNFCLKPFILLSIALMVDENRLLISIINQEQQRLSINKARVANQFAKEPETRHHFVINLEVQPQPIDLNPSKEYNRSKILEENINNAPVALPSASIIETIEIQHQGSVENMMSRVQSRKSALHKLTSMKQLNEIDLQKIQENPGHELQNYFCISLRREKQQEEKKQIEEKIENNILKDKSNNHIQTSELIKQFILEDFICCSPKHEENNYITTNQQGKSSKYSKSKGSLRGNKTFRILEREHDIDLNDKENTVEQSTKHEISENQISGIPTHCSNRRIDNKTHILKISDTDKDVGELEQIDINSPNRRAIHRNTYDTHVIPEEVVKSKRKRNRRGTTKEVSQPYLLQEKLIQVYFPGRNKSEFDNFVRSKKKNFDRSQFFNHSSKKQPSKGKEKPIVHESDDQHTEFFVPKF